MQPDIHPYSIVDGNWSNEADRFNFDVTIDEIDGVRLIDEYRLRKIAPGSHKIRLTSAKSDLRGNSVYTEYTLEAKPCMKYHLSAQHKHLYTNDDWEVKVEELPIKSCQS